MLATKRRLPILQLVAHTVYVILLKRDGEDSESRLPPLYVGSTAGRPEEHLASHQRGDCRGSRTIARWRFDRLCPELFEFVPAAFDQTSARAQERRHAQRLAEVGFLTHMDGHRFRPKPGVARLFGSAELARTSDAVSTLIHEVDRLALRRLSLDERVDVLCCDRTYRVDHLIGRDPDVVGRLCHFERDAVRQVVKKALTVRSYYADRAFTLSQAI